MHERIYYTDPRCLAFDADVTRALERDSRPAVTLSRSAFYPTSGGQPHDVGTLGGVEVVDVIDDDGEVVHVLSAPLAAGAHVSGEIQRSRRFDHMQQHTGQHVLSAAFDRLFENATVSFHLGAEACSIDLARETSPAEAERAFAEANRIVFEDRPVSIRFVSEQEASRLPLRKDPARQGLLRLIEIHDFDLSACGGTHVSRTGEIGAIALLGTERIRGGSRISFACGARALGFFTMYREAVTGSVRILSVLPGELPAAIEKLHGESKDLRKTVGRLQESLAGHEASRLLAVADDLQGFKLVAAVLEGWEPQGLKSVASSAVADAAGVIVILVSSSSPASVVIARSTDVALDAGKTLRDLAAKFGGKGGGRPELAQGGGFTGAPGDILDAARQVIASAIRT